jgi:hypothetical protein
MIQFFKHVFLALHLAPLVLAVFALSFYSDLVVLRKLAVCSWISKEKPQDNSVTLAAENELRDHHQEKICNSLARFYSPSRAIIKHLSIY